MTDRARLSRARCLVRQTADQRGTGSRRRWGNTNPTTIRGARAPSQDPGQLSLLLEIPDPEGGRDRLQSGVDHLHHLVLE